MNYHLHGQKSRYKRRIWRGINNSLEQDAKLIRAARVLPQTWPYPLLTPHQIWLLAFFLGSADIHSSLHTVWSPAPCLPHQLFMRIMFGSPTCQNRPSVRRSCHRLIQNLFRSHNETIKAHKIMRQTAPRAARTKFFWKTTSGVSSSMSGMRSFLALG